jgi:hypothetical protein
VYIADIITTATITIIVATIITITAIGKTYRVVAASKLALRRTRVAAHAAAFSLFRPRADHTKARITRSRSVTSRLARAAIPQVDRRGVETKSARSC